jgi:hypothetical protein
MSHCWSRAASCELACPWECTGQRRTTLSHVKRSITAAVIAATAAVLLSGCGTGRFAQTAEQVAPVPGYSETEVINGRGTYAVLNATLAYNGVKGYKSGDEAEVQVTLINESDAPVTVTLRSSAGTVSGGTVTIPPSGSASPEVTLKLTQDVQSGQYVPMTIDFGGKATFQAQIPMDTPLSPAPRETQEVTGDAGEGH